jgi:pimeloyl-ACP methyl ester carboxylesterase
MTTGILAGMLAFSGCAGIAVSPGNPLDAIPTQHVQVGDIQVGYKVLGQGPPLLMIMGFGSTMDLWEPTVVMSLAGQHRVFLFDNRGMGETSAKGGEFTIEQFADDTSGLIDALSLPQATILGWSMGTNIALELALRHPEKVNALLLIAADCGGSQAIPPAPDVLKTVADTSGSAAERGMRLFGLLFPDEWLKAHPEINRRFPRPSETSPAESVQRQAQAMANYQGCYDRLPQIQVPTLLITGTEDVLAPPGNSSILASRIPAPWLASFRGGGHGLMYQDPPRLIRTIQTFLQDSLPLR